MGDIDENKLLNVEQNCDNLPRKESISEVREILDCLSVEEKDEIQNTDNEDKKQVFKRYNQLKDSSKQKKVVKIDNVAIDKSDHTIKTRVGNVYLKKGMVIKACRIEYTYWIKEWLILHHLHKYFHTGLPEFYKPEYKDSCIRFHMKRYGQTLGELINNGAVDFVDTLQIIYDISYTLTFLNFNYIIHRDIKPENIVLDKNRARIIDFSHSVKLQLHTKKLEYNVTTLQYQAPEVFCHSTYEFNIDSWAIGILLIEMLSGIRLYHMIKTKYDYQSFFMRDQKEYINDLLDLIDWKRMSNDNEDKTTKQSRNGNEDKQFITDLIRLCLSKDKDKRIESSGIFTMIADYFHKNKIILHSHTYSHEYSYQEDTRLEKDDEYFNTKIKQINQTIQEIKQYIDYTLDIKRDADIIRKYARIWKDVRVSNIVALIVSIETLVYDQILVLDDILEDFRSLNVNLTRENLYLSLIELFDTNEKIQMWLE